MSIADDNIEVTFRPAEQHSSVSLQAVRQRMVHFLEHFADAPFVDADFAALLEGVTGEERFQRLTELSGYVGAPEGLLRDVVRQLERASNGHNARVTVGEVELPYHLLLAVLEELVPGSGFLSVKRVDQLEKLTNTRVAPEEREPTQQVLDLFPVRLSWHTIRQMRLSAAIAHQYYPFVRELDSTGQVNTWVGQFFRGIVEQMYRNRVIFVMNMACPVYCRFCFRKHKECRNQRSPTKDHVKQAVAYIRNAPEVKEIVLTGGDPFMNRATLRHAFEELVKVPHVQTLRVASRAISYFPEMFLRENTGWLNYLQRVNLELLEKNKRLEVATHFLHPDELSVSGLDVISRLVRAGIPVYVQTPYVRGCNESGHELVPLYNALRAAGAEIHYIFMPTSPIQGNKEYWAPLTHGLAAARYLRAHLSDRAMPHITTATSIGKIDWNTSGWAVERDEDHPDRLWLRTPYTEEYYAPFAPIMRLGEEVRPNAEGTLDAVFLCEAGGEELFAGPRVPSSSPQAYAYKLRQTEETSGSWLEVLQARALADQRALDLCLGARPTPCLARNHPARVELDCGASDDQIEQALTYIREDPRITDVVVSRKDDVLTGFSRNLAVLDRLVEIRHVLAVRLRSLKLIHRPQDFARPVLDRLGGRSKLRTVRPHRLEIETLVLHHSELGSRTGRVVRELRQRGITVYGNTPLLGLINDNEAEMLRISYIYRELGVEFCNVYVAGTPLQGSWNEEHPIDLNGVIDIATHVRRFGSGREVPRYLLRTELGEIDYGIAPRVFGVDEEGVVRATLRPHDLAYYRDLDPNFQWPAGVELDDEGHPVVRLSGVSLDNPAFLTGPTE